MEKLKLKKQFESFLKTPTIERKFTKALYELLYLQGNMLAHFDKLGFLKARIWESLEAFDTTLAAIRYNKKINFILDIDPEIIARARYQIASLQASILSQRIQIDNDTIKKLQSQFTKDLI